MSQTSPGPYSPKVMRALAVSGLALGVVNLLWGLTYVLRGNSGGWSLVMIGGICLALMLAFIPLARRRGRM